MKKLNIVVINDNIFSDVENEYIQYYHLAKDINILKKDNDYSVKLDLNNGFFVDITQKNEVDNFRVLKGKQTKPFSLVSKGFGQYDLTETLSYEKKDKDFSFLTIIDIHDGTKAVCSIEGKNLKFKKNDINTTLVLKENYKFNDNISHVEINVNENITIKNTKLNKYEHCAYLFLDDNETIKANYTNSDIVIALPKKYKRAIIMYYLRNDIYESRRGILGIVDNINDKPQVKQYNKFHVPNIISHNVNKDKEGKYTFNVDAKYDLPLKYRWYVYFNGSNEYYTEIDNGTFTYDLNKNGQYVIMVSINDRLFQEIDFYEFTPIDKQAQ